MPGKNVSPTGARIPLAYTWSSEPSGRNEMIAPEYLDVGVQWSQGAEMPTSSRPLAVSTMLFTSPTGAGSVSTVRCFVNFEP